VLWLPFDLHPEYPPTGIPLADLHRRYGIGVGGDDPLHARFAEASLEYNRPPVVPNTRLALRLSELAREQGLHGAFHDRLMDAYWSEATNIGDPDELRRLAAEVGLESDVVERVVADPSAFLDVVEASTRQAQSIGINAIPAFLLDRKLIVLGAQPFEVFRNAFAEIS
jgi:predicted DsbA family dithiol-disulfide isomerase